MVSPFCQVSFFVNMADKLTALESIKLDVRKSFAKVYAALKERELQTLRQIDAIWQQYGNNNSILALKRNCLQNIDISYENEDSLFQEIHHFGIIDFKKLNIDSNIFMMEDYVNPKNDHMYSYKCIDGVNGDKETVTCDEFKQTTPSEKCVCYVNLAPSIIKSQLESSRSVAQDHSQETNSKFELGVQKSNEKYTEKILDEEKDALNREKDTLNGGRHTLNEGEDEEIEKKLDSEDIKDIMQLKNAVKSDNIEKKKGIGKVLKIENDCSKIKLKVIKETAEIEIEIDVLNMEHSSPEIVKERASKEEGKEMESMHSPILHPTQDWLEHIINEPETESDLIMEHSTIECS